MNISLFIPAYNEEEIVERNISAAYELLSDNFTDFELVIVDDSSTDSTGTILKRMALKKKKLRYMRYSNGPSRRENLAEAMKTARYEVVGYMDLDLATPLLYVIRLAEEIEKGADIAIGSRRVRESRVERSIYRNAWSFLYHRTVRTLFNSHIHDYQCGCKLFRKEVFTELAKKVGYDTQFQRGWFWDAELLIAAEKKGHIIKEIPVNWKEGKKSSFNFFREMKVVVYILKLRLRGFR